MGALADAAAAAPREPGVYFLLGRERVLLYVGKAGDLRRRLTDHARNGLRSVPIDTVRAVGWETCPDEDAAFAHEADLIVMLRPPCNASHADQDRDCYISVEPESGEGMVFRLTNAVAAPGRAYGTYPHVAKGAFSHTAKRTKAGYNALLRLLWVEHDVRIPARIGGASPPVEHRAPVAAELRRPLHDLLSGRSARLLDRLDGAHAPEFMRTTLQRDQSDAREFFALAPRRLRRFRERHDLASGPVSGAAMADLLAVELRDAIGDISIIGRGGAPAGW